MRTWNSVEVYGSSRLQILVAEPVASENSCMSLRLRVQSVSQFGDLSVSATSLQTI